MKVHTSDKIIAYLTLLSGLSISAVAVWYSVAGLVAIFAAAAIPIVIMGVALEVSKLVATVWLKMNWKRAPILIRTYLLSAIVILMLITSMGIFGFLSKAHLDQAVPTGDVQDKVALIDEKIRTEKDNVDAARKALKQMDESVDQTMARSTDEKGADKAAALRRSQQRERTNLQNDIAKAQKHIAALNEERAPIAKDLRKIEAEVGPIKYIAALIYGDNPDTNLLEKAVRWVIIIIVMVFDPLAVILLIASQISFQWFRQSKDEDEEAVSTEEPKKSQKNWTDFFTKKPAYELDDGPLTEEQVDKIKELSGVDQHAYLKKPWVWKVPGGESVGPLVADKTISLFETTPEPEKPQQTAGWDDDEIPEPKQETSGKQKLSLSNIFKNKKLKTVASGNPLDISSGDFYEHLTEREEEKAAAETKKSNMVDPSGTSVDDWNKMIEEAEKAVEEEKEQEEKEIIDAASESEKAAMQAWKHDHPDSSLKLQRRLLERGVITKLPWEDYLKPQPDFSEESEESKKKDSDLDGNHRRTSSQEEQRNIVQGYVQNAEQGEETIWQRIKKGF
jgi:hypothetical protein